MRTLPWGTVRDQLIGALLALAVAVAVGGRFMWGRRLALRMLRDASSLFVKLERRVGLLDETGGRDISLQLGPMRTTA